MRVTVLAFARIREVIGASSTALELPEGATAASLWRELAERHPELVPLESSTRLARNGALVERGAVLSDGDEIGVMPPFGGG